MSEELMDEDIRIVLIKKFNHLREINRYREARMTAQELIQQFPSLEDGYELLSVVCLDLNEYKQSLHWANEALKINPNSYYGWETKIRTYFTLDDWVNFDQTVNTALKIYPQNPLFFYLIGVRFYCEDKKDIGHTYIEKAVTLEPNNSLYMAYYSYSLAKHGEYLKSVDCERQALLLDVEDDSTFSILGSSAYERKDYQKAIEFFTNAVRLDPQSKEHRTKYLSVLQTKFGFYRFLIAIMTMKRKYYWALYIFAFIFFKPLIILIFLLFYMTHWITKMIVHVKVFGWTLKSN